MKNILFFFLIFGSSLHQSTAQVKESFKAQIAYKNKLIAIAFNKNYWRSLMKINEKL